MTEANFAAYSFSHWINTIGYDWKSYAGAWNLKDSLVYFVQTAQGEVWRLVFTGFGGSTNGQIVLGKELLATTALTPAKGPALFSVYPNPAVDRVQVEVPPAMEIPTAWSLWDAMGRQVATGSWAFGRTLSVDLSSVPSGCYYLQLAQNSRILGSRALWVQ
jgi:hypothetical protein